jgi:ribosomal protein S12 methylthiotransferase
VIDDELIELIAGEEKILKYLDIPIQHIDDTVLKRMRRGGTGGEIRTLIKKLRERVPGVVIRTSLIVGHPGEGEAEFEALCEFLREAKLERAGVFVFSPEEGTAAFDMPDHCGEETAGKRAELVMELQAGIMDDFARSQIGKTLEAIICGRDEASGLLWGRTYADSPEVDGRVTIDGGAKTGDIVRVKIDAVIDGDLAGELI